MDDMDLNDIIANNIIRCMDEIDKSEEFHKEFPNNTVEEYVAEATKLGLKRLRRILTIGENRRITLVELYKIAKVLDVKISTLFAENITISGD